MSQQRQFKGLPSVIPLQPEPSQSWSPPYHESPPFQPPPTNTPLPNGQQPQWSVQPPKTNQCHRCGKELGFIDRIGLDKQTTFCRTCSNQKHQSLQRFRMTFLDVTRSGKLSDTEWAALQAVATQERLDKSEALAFIMNDALALVEHIIVEAIANGSVTNDIEQQVSQMIGALLVPSEIAIPLLDRVTYLRRTTNMRLLDHAVTELEVKGNVTEDDERHIHRLQATLAILPDEAQPFYQRLVAIKQRANIQRFQRAAALIETNGEVTEEAQQSLRQLQQTLAIQNEIAQPIFQRLVAIKKRANIQRFQRAAVLVESKGDITEEAQQSLIQLQQSLAISNEIAQPIFQRLAAIKQRANIQRFQRAATLIETKGEVTEEAQQSLIQLQQSLAISNEIAQPIHQRLASLKQRINIQRFQNTIAFVEAKGEVTEETQHSILQLQQSLAIPNEIAAPIFQRLAYLKKLTRIRKGNLPTISTDVHLESDEICHLETFATYHKVNTKSTTNIEGRLVATNKRLHFLSTTRGMTINWNNIMRVEVRTSLPISNGMNLELPKGTGGVYLELSRGTGNGLYTVSDPTLVGAVLDTLVKIAKRQLVVTNAEPSRHIPQDVKNAVWQRDGGKCTQCSSTSYLEYDHIIPHTKGGANTLENVQLLCRSCNLKKSDRI